MRSHIYRSGLVTMGSLVLLVALSPIGAAAPMY
jgi:hypothetical protein